MNRKKTNQVISSILFFTIFSTIVLGGWESTYAYEGSNGNSYDRISRQQPVDFGPSYFNRTNGKSVINVFANDSERDSKINIIFQKNLVNEEDSSEGNKKDQLIPQEKKMKGSARQVAEPQQNKELQKTRIEIIEVPQEEPKIEHKTKEDYEKMSNEELSQQDDIGTWRMQEDRWVEYEPGKFKRQWTHVKTWYANPDSSFIRVAFYAPVTVRPPNQGLGSDLWINEYSMQVSASLKAMTYTPRRPLRRPFRPTIDVSQATLGIKRPISLNIKRFNPMRNISEKSLADIFSNSKPNKKRNKHNIDLSDNKISVNSSNPETQFIEYEKPDKNEKSVDEDIIDLALMKARSLKEETFRKPTRAQQEKEVLEDIASELIENAKEDKVVEEQEALEKALILLIMAEDLKEIIEGTKFHELEELGGVLLSYEQTCNKQLKEISEAYEDLWKLLAVNAEEHMLKANVRIKMRIINAKLEHLRKKNASELKPYELEALEIADNRLKVALEDYMETTREIARNLDTLQGIFNEAVRNIPAKKAGAYISVTEEATKMLIVPKPLEVISDAGNEYALEEDRV